MTKDLPYRPCVGVVLCNADGLVFAGERFGMPGAWQMPQGGIDDGETPEAAALRELEEETAVPAAAVQKIAETAEWMTYDFPAEIDRAPFRGRFRGQKQRWFLFRLTGSDSAIDLKRAHQEFGAWTWLTADEMLARIVAFKRPVYAAVLSEFAPHLVPLVR